VTTYLPGFVRMCIMLGTLSLRYYLRDPRFLMTYGCFWFSISPEFMVLRNIGTYQRMICLSPNIINQNYTRDTYFMLKKVILPSSQVYNQNNCAILRRKLMQPNLIFKSTLDHDKERRRQNKKTDV
jgi:hypothetical protein